MKRVAGLQPKIFHTLWFKAFQFNPYLLPTFLKKSPQWPSFPTAATFPHRNRLWARKFKGNGKQKAIMKEVYYKGNPYQYKVMDLNGKRQFNLYENGVLKHSVEENELDVRTIVSLILDAYYKNVKTASKTSVLQ
jgi:hypothetical protein